MPEESINLEHLVGDDESADEVKEENDEKEEGLRRRNHSLLLADPTVSSSPLFLVPKR